MAELAGSSPEQRILSDLSAQPALSDGPAPRQLEPFGDGHSGFTYSVQVGNTRCILRLSPPGARIAGPADIGRQGRIMAALADAGLPVPRVLAASSEPAVDGRSFALMEFVAGHSWRAAVERSGPVRIAEQAIEFLHRLALIPGSATGIGDERPSSVGDELERWGNLLTRAPEFLHDDGATLRKLLEEASAAVPGVKPSLVHGDYQLANMLFGPDGIVAVVDWEIAALGDRTLDFASLAVGALCRRYAPEPSPVGDAGISISELRTLYGVEEERAVYFLALTCFKYGAVLGYNLGLHRSGKRVDPIYADLTRTIGGLLLDGRLILEQGLGVLGDEGDVDAAHRPRRATRGLA